MAADPPVTMAEMSSSKYILLRFCLSVGAALLVGSGCANAPQFRRLAALAPGQGLTQITAYDYDWDDNVFFMPTKIVLFKKGTNEERAISTADFALIREQIGKPGPWADYELRQDDMTGSFRYFRDGANGENYFRADLIDAIIEPLKDPARPLTWNAPRDKIMNGLRAALSDLSAPVPKWLGSRTEIYKVLRDLLTDPIHRHPNLGPSWEAYVYSLSRRETALWTTEITARGHSGRQMIEGQAVLQAIGAIAFLPPEENMYAVSNPRYKGSAASPSAIKALNMIDILDRVQARGLSPDMVHVYDQNGMTKKQLHLWGFSDDDFGNYETALKILSAEVKKGRWPDVKIALFFTGGKNHPEQKPHVTVIRSDGSARAALKAEIGEADRVLCKQLAPPLLLNP